MATTFIGGVGDLNGGVAAQLQVLEGRTGGVHRRIDTQADFARVFIDVIACASWVYGALVSPALMVT
nr:hypothetical protein [Pseudomonas monteilii]